MTTSGDLAQLTIGGATYTIPGAASGLTQAQVDASVNFLVPNAGTSDAVSTDGSTNWQKRFSWTPEFLWGVNDTWLVSTRGVTANPGGTGNADLTSLKIGPTSYDIAAGGGGTTFDINALTAFPSTETDTVDKPTTCGRSTDSRRRRLTAS